MTQPSSFEQRIESDIHQLAAEIKRNREHPEFQHEGERSLIKESLRAFPRPDPSTTSATPQRAATARSPLPAYVDGASPEVKLEIEYLLDVALKHGISKALSESQKSPYFVQDAFHDALAGALYPELQKRGIVK